MDTILIFGCNCQKWLIFHFLYRLTLLNFDLNGPAELPAGKGSTRKRGRPAGKRGPFGGRARPVGVARRWIKALPAGRRQHGAAAGEIRGRPVGVARRWDKGLPAGRLQQGSAPDGRKGESDVDALVFPPHASTPLSELMHEYPFLHPMHHF